MTVKADDPRPAPRGSLLTIADVAERCQVSTRTVRRWIDAEWLEIFKFGRAVRISEDDLAKFLFRFKKDK